MSIENQNEQMPEIGETPRKIPGSEGIQTAKPVRIAVQLPKTKPIVTYVILGITVLFYILQVISQYVIGYDMPLYMLAKINEAIMAGQVWRLFSPMLIHGSIMHIAFNMYALYVIGRGIERYYGHLRFIGLYLISAFAGNLMSFYLSPEPSVGASTAIFGLIAAQGIFIYKNRFLYGKNYRSMLINIGTVVLFNLALGLSKNIDNWGHLGGLLGGLAIAWFSGPQMKVQQEIEEYKLNDQNKPRDIWLAHIVSFVVLSALAAIRILG